MENGISPANVLGLLGLIAASLVLPHQGGRKSYKGRDAARFLCRFSYFWWNLTVTAQKQFGSWREGE